MWDLGIFVKLIAQGYLALLLDDIEAKLPERVFRNANYARCSSTKLAYFRLK